ncbi:hypothetical protein GCM10009799_11940 [Nocardiopsis rhodophaea]|uniref:DUF2157 domain-containing protein n=1 Tax=Nocardiopsis rhodophaea TaxID=280238 RepID=A0ABN2SJN9_9ACTN
MSRQARARDSEAREEVLRQLVVEGVLSAEQAGAVGTALRRAGVGGGSGRTLVRGAEVAGYAGGGLVLAGVFALLATAWQDLDVAVRVLLLAAIAVAAAGSGLVMAGGPRVALGPDSLAGRLRGLSAGPTVPAVRRRVAGVLFALAALAAAFAVSVGLDGAEGLEWVAPLVGLVVALSGYAALPSAVALVISWWMSGTLVIVAFNAFVTDRIDVTLATGLTLVVVGAAWAALTAWGALVERGLGIGLGAAMALLGAQFLLFREETSFLGYMLTLGAAALCLGFYRWERTVVLLVFGILGITVGVTELVWDLTGGAIGAAAILLTAGAVLLASCWVGIRLHRDGAAEPARAGGPEEAEPTSTGPAPEGPAPNGPTPTPGADRPE